MTCFNHVCRRNLCLLVPALSVVSDDSTQRVISEPWLSARSALVQWQHERIWLPASRRNPAVSTWADCRARMKEIAWTRREDGVLTQCGTPRNLLDHKKGEWDMPRNAHSAQKTDFLRLSGAIGLTCNFLCQWYQFIWNELTIGLTCQMLILAFLSLSQAADVQKLLVLT